MSQEFHRRVTSVAAVPHAVETTSALSIGATLIPLSDSGDFTEFGGHALIDGTVYAFTAMDEGDESGTPSITLASPGLTAAVAAETPVEECDATGEVVVDWLVGVTDDVDSSTNTAYLTHALIPLMDSSMPVGSGDSVTVVVDESGTWWVVEVHGKTPRLTLEFADAAAPSASPAVVAVGLLESFILRCANVPIGTQVTFQVSSDAGATWADLPGMPVRTTVIEAKVLPSGDAFQVDTSYQFRTIASNDTTTAAPSAAVTAQLNTDAAAVVASQVVTAQVIAGFALLGQVNIGGDTFTLTPPGVDPENLAGGLRIQLTNGGLIHLPADGSAATFSGNVVADSLEVTNGASLRGTSALHGTLGLASTVTDPTAAPTVARTYEWDPCPVSNARGLCRNVAGTGWVTVDQSGPNLVEFSDAGTVLDVSDPADFAGHTPHGLTRIGSTYYSLARSSDTGWYLISFNSTLDHVATVALSWLTAPRGATAALGAAGSDLAIYLSLGSASAVELHRSTTAGVEVGSLISITLAGAPGGVYYGAGDLGATRWVVHPEAADVSVYSTAGALQASDTWPRPAGKDVRGLWWDGTYFWVVDNAGVVRRLEPAADAPAATYWWSYAWVDSDTHTTLVSPQKQYTRPKRAKLRVTAAAAPQQAVSGTHVANRINLFAATTSSGTKYQQGSTLAVGTTAADFTAVATSGTTAPAANNWSGVAPTGAVSADQGGFSIDGLSNGSVGTGSFRTSVQTAANAGLDATLTGIAATAPTADQLIYATGTDTFATTGLTAYIRTLLNDADAPTARTTLLARDRRAVIDTLTTTTYTLATADEGKVLQINNSTGHTLTVPDNATVFFAVGSEIEIVRLHATGGVTIAAGAGVTVNSRGGLLSINGQYGSVRLRKRAVDTWVLSGDLA